MRREWRGLTRDVADLAAQVTTYADLGFDMSQVDMTGLSANSDGDAVLVFPHTLVPVQELIVRMRLPGGRGLGVFDRNFEDPDRYHPADPGVPRDRPYLMFGFEPGVEYLNVPPRDALPAIDARGRFPATMEEGLAAFLHDPEVLQRNRCFSLAGSTRGDKRVPGLWISGRAPKLGWCFAGVPHTWLGTASVARRALD